MPEPPHLPGTLPSFAKPLGLDFIITAQDRILLVELQHGFGRYGLLQLFPALGRVYRQTYRQARRQYGKSRTICCGFREICSDKILTYRHFAAHQPSSFIYRRWGPAVWCWLLGLGSDLILAKPPRGSCGRGIRVLRRTDLLRSGEGLSPGSPLLLQEYVESRHLTDGTGQAHIGCIRHIVLLVSDGRSLGFVHLPPYWRVAPLPLSQKTDELALTANISNGAFPLPVSEPDARLVRRLTEKLSTELVCTVLSLPDLTRGRSQVMDTLHTGLDPRAKETRSAVQ